MTLRGTTGDFSLDVVLRLLADTKKTGELSIRGTGGEGALGIAEGRVVTAVFGSELPIPALGAIFQITEAAFEFTPWHEAPAANLEGDLQDNLRKVEEYRQWLASVRAVIPSDSVRFRLSERAAEQGAVTFTSDRWRVVLAVNGQRNVIDLAQHLHLERDAALTTLAGLVRDEVIQTIDPAADAPTPATPTLAAPPPAAPDPAPPVSEDSEWTAALLRKAESAAPAAPEPAPPVAGAPPSTPIAPPEPIVPVAADPVAQEWGAPTPAATEPEPAPSPMPQEWGAPPPPPPAEPAATPMPVDWGTPAPAPEPESALPPVSQDWAAPTPAAAEPEPALPPMPDAWAAPSPIEPAPAPLDDRLAALFGNTPAPAAPSEASAPAPAADSWMAPAPAADEWNAPAPSAPAAPAELDPRLGALAAAPPPAPATMAPASAAPAAPSEWGPPPELGAPVPKKKGMFGRFGKEDAAPASASSAAMQASASSRAGLLAAFSNALLSEYNNGQYGKGRVDDRIPSLLMRVDEQADPIDKPLPIVDDRLDVQALERVSLPETQAVPYLALLVSTIYADAEKAFGRDKAKRGYKVAQKRVFAGDNSALGGPDLAGKLPKV